MDDIQITPERQRRRLLLFSSMLFGIVALVDLLWVSILSRSRAAREPNASLQEGFSELASLALVLGILFSSPAIVFMGFFKRLRCVQYVGAVVAFGMTGAAILGCVFYYVDMSTDPFPWRAHVLEDTLRGAVIGFHLGFVGGTLLAPFALLALPRQRALPQGFGKEEECSSDAVPSEFAPADEAAIR